MIRKLLSVVFILLAIGVIVVAVIACRRLMATRPKPERKAKERRATVVEVLTTERTDEVVSIRAMGTVIPARTVALRPEITGRVVWHHPKLVAGGRLRKGEDICRLYDKDYKLRVEQQQGQVERALFDLDVEKGRSVIAKREWKLLEKEIATTKEGRALALREPHLRYAKAALEAARSALDLAKIDLKRTVLTAPFNAVVREESVEIGQLANPATVLATLAGTDVFWVQAAVPLDRLKDIRIPETNGAEGAVATVTVESPEGPIVACSGKVIRLLPGLDPVGRMARVLIEIADPLGIESKKAPLLLDTYVRCRIAGPVLKNVIVIPRLALHEGGEVWIMDADDKLDLRQVEIVWKEADRVMIATGIEAGKRVVTTRIGSPIQGLDLRLKDADKADPATEEAETDSMGDTEADSE